MRLSLIVLLLAAVLFPACSRSEASPVPRRTTAEEKAPSAKVCAALVASFRARLKVASGRCQADAGCEIYPAGLVDCGGPTDKVSATALEKIKETFLAKDCDWVMHCAPRSAVAHCEKGRCVERPD